MHKIRLHDLQFWCGVTFIRAWGWFQVKGFVPHAQSAPFITLFVKYLLMQLVFPWARHSCHPRLRWSFIVWNEWRGWYRLTNHFKTNRRARAETRISPWLSRYYTRKHEFPCATTCADRITAWQHPVDESRSSLDSRHSSLWHYVGLCPRCSRSESCTAALKCSFGRDCEKEQTVDDRSGWIVG